MSLIEWNDSFSVNNETIDKQHRGLIELLNGLSTEFDEQREKRLLENTIEKLFDYTKYHFSIEEYLMRQANFPDYEKHKAEHDAFVKKVKDFISNFIDGREGLTREIVDFLMEWVKNHILKTDKEYIPFLSKK
ncbi:MAG: bacteriohemerythrin [Brevinematia bacterium]